MKKIFTLFTFLYFCLTATAQHLPDPSFENWSSSFNGDAQLANWNGSNVTQVGFSFTFVYKEASGRIGACAKVLNKEVGALGITETAPGYLTLGKPWSYLEGISAGTATAGTDGGIAFTYRPDSLAVWIKRTGNGQENYNIVYYSWQGTAQGTAYKAKGGGCTSTSHTDEESDIIPQDKNECTTTVPGTLVGLGWKKETKVYNDWTEIKVPINYSLDSKPEKMNIIFSAGNYPNKRANSGIYNGNTLYVDDARLIYSSAIHELYINNVKYNAFKPNVTEYTYTLGLGATEIPDILAKRSGRTLSGSEISITEGIVDGEPTLITVYAEDGSSSTTYTINFVSKQSDNSRLKDIKVNGTSIDGFNEYIYSYNVALPYGTTSIPEITVVKGEEKQTYDIAYSPSTLPCTATIKVFAQDITKTTTYTINFSVAQLTDNTLQNILVAGNPIPGFAPTKNIYTVELPQGTTSVPEIKPISAYPDGAQKIITKDNGLDGVYTIDVKAPGNPNTRTYKISFKITASTNCSLQGISIGGIPLEAFDPAKTTYDYQLPQGTTELPEITYTPGDAYQQITVTSGGVNGKYKIEVTSQSGAKKTYTINFSVYQSNISTLNDIKIGGTSIPDFASDKTDYSYELPSGTTVLSEITYTKGEENQTVNIKSDGVNGVTTIRVTAEDGSSTTYRITFSVQKSTNANLLNITIDGTPLEGFRPDVLNYTYILDNTATKCPTIAVETEFPNQRVEIVAPQLEGVATIKVYSETGESFNIYTIDFSFEKSSNNYLKSISIDGIAIAEFDKLTNDYTVTIANDDMPAIAYEKDDTLQSVATVNNGIEGGYTLIVTAENGAKNIYNVTFNRPQSGNALLKDIKIYNAETQTFASLPDFASDKFSYIDTLDLRTKVVPNIHPVVGQKGQIVTIQYGKTNATTTLHVTAEDGTTQDYTIAFPVRKSNITTLENILVSDAEFTFDANQSHFDITLPYGTTKVPTIEWEKSVEEQTVTLISRNLQDTTAIVVTAENGDTRTYKLTFNVAPSGKANTISYLVEGLGLFTESTEIALPYGTTQMPKIKVNKNYPEQTIFVKDGGIYASTVITVKSNIEGIADNVYTITPKVATTHLAMLKGIKVNGTAIPNFESNKFNYVVNVDNANGEQPTIEELFDDASIIIERPIENTKHVQLKVTMTDYPYSSVYNVYFYYPSDVIPNGEFTEWTKPVYNQDKGDKPVSWQVPADVANSHAGTMHTGYEVQKADETTVKFETTYWAASADAIPAIASIGTVSCTLATFFKGGNTADFSGNIPYRNTPDNAIIRYKHEKKAGNGALFAFRFFEDGAEHNLDYTETSTGDWKEYYHALNTKKLVPTAMNIAINATNQTKDASKDAKLLVDYIRFAHSSEIDSLVFDGTTYVAFDGTNEHTFTLDAEYQGVPSLSVIGNVPDQEHTIHFSNEVENGANMVRTATITSKAEDGTSTVYTVKFNRPKSGNSSLNGIQVNGTALADFAADKFEYNYSVENGNTRLPDITVIGASAYQNIEIIPNKLESATIRVTAENGTVSNYKITFVEQRSNDVTLQNITIAGNPTDFVFDVTNNDYTVALAAEAQIPAVTFIKNSDGQTVTLTNGETTTLRVVAENGTDNATYTITFVRQAKETNATLQAIVIDNELLANFSADIYDYTYARSNNSEIFLTHEKTFYADSVATTIYTDSVVWDVTNNTIQNRYKLTFTTTVSDNADLKEIFVEGNPLPDFDPEQYNYSIVSDTIPEISVEKGEHGQNVDIATTSDQITITVTAENGTTEQIYTIDIVSPQPKSNDALLDGILIDGTPLADFAADEFDYAYVLPTHTTELPTIAVVKGDGHQTISIETNGTNGVTTITVMAEDGTTQTYNITFSVLLCNDSYLTDIEINGEPLRISATGFSCDKDFEKESTDYTLTFDNKTELLPIITTTSQHSDCQTIQLDTIVKEDKYAYDIKIKVTAENQVDSTTYMLHLNREKSDNALLSMIYVQGAEIENFNESTFDYMFDVEYGTDTVPAVTWDTQEDAQNVTPTKAENINGTTTIKVVAENGVSENTYSVRFNVLPSSDATLSGIYIGGELISTSAKGFVCDENFSAGEYEYHVSLPVGTTDLPEITWATSVPDVTSVALESNGVNGTTTITVVAQDGTTLEYIVIFEVLKSTNTKLADLLVEGASIGENQDNYEVYFGNVTAGNIASGFNPDSTVYTLLYPIGTDTATFITKADVTFVKSEDAQQVEITQESTSEVKVLITAEDGKSKKAYVIKLEVLLSNNSLLKNIKLNGISLKDFDSNVFYYEHLIYQGDTIPTIEAIKSEDSQTVSILKMNVGEETIITCQAEDMSVSSYKILFKYSAEKPGQTPTADDVCWTALGSGRWKASSKRDNVYLYLFDAMGKLLDKQKIPLLDPNSDLCSRDSNGATFYFDKKGQVYIYLFVFNEKKRIKSGKILY